MKLYEYLGIDHMMNEADIPMDYILSYVPQEHRTCLEAVRKVTLKVPVEREGHCLFVMEVALKAPRGIEQIALQLQKAIKHRILFVFRCDRRFLILWRNFDLNGKTENVTTDHTSYSTDWIYEEYLNDDLLYFCKTERINANQAPCYNRSLPVVKNEDNEMRYFTDVIRNVYELSGCIINSDVVSARYLIDWVNAHECGIRIDLEDVAREAARHGYGTTINDFLFFGKDQVGYLCQELSEARYYSRLGRTGRYPWTYFEGKYMASTADEAALTAVYCDAISEMPYAYDFEDYSISMFGACRYAA